MEMTMTKIDVSLKDWAKIHQPDETYAFGVFWHNIDIVLEKIAGIIARNTKTDIATIQENTRVILVYSMERSRFDPLLIPVFRIEIPGTGMAFTMRHVHLRRTAGSWIVSVESPHEMVVTDFMELFPLCERVKTEGLDDFPSEYVYESYAEDKCKFTFKLPGGSEYIFTFFWIFGHHVLKK